MSKNIYDGILQSICGPWAEFTHNFAKCGTLVRTKFFTDIYSWAGIYLVGFSLLFTILYYFYFNRRFGKYYKLASYFKTMFANSSVILVFTLVTGYRILASFECSAGSRLFCLSAMNFIYGLFFFFVLSLICQGIAFIVRRILSVDLSPMGNRTPF